MKIFTIIGGVNGAGKSSLTGVLKSERRNLGVIIDVDKLAAAAGVGALEGGRIAIDKIEECLTRGVTFTQETTLSGQKTENTARRVKEAGYYIRLYYVGLNTLEEHIARIENRVKKGGHSIPVLDVQRRYGDRFAPLLRVLPYCDEAVFFDNDNGFVKVAEYANGEILTKGEYKPEWLSELMADMASI